MKFKTTAIAMAVAGTVAAPVAVQAGADEMYASARIGLEYKDTAGTSDISARSVASRFGARGETDLGNGLTGFGRYEWGVDFNNTNGGSGAACATNCDISGDGSVSVRHRYVGLKGDFGSVRVGQTYNTFYNFVVGPGDIPWVGSGVNQVAYVGRTDNALTYAGSSDAIAFGATAYMVRDTDEEIVNAAELGASYTFGNDMVLALAAQGTAGSQSDTPGNTEGVLVGNGNDKTVFGVMLSGVMLGDASIGIGAQVQDDDYSVLGDVVFNNFYGHVEYEFIDEDSPGNPRPVLDSDDVEPIMFVVGYNQPLGRKTQMYYEAVFNDADTDDSDDDSTQFFAVLKYDIM
jgi:predicted porin